MLVLKLQNGRKKLGGISKHLGQSESWFSKTTTGNTMLYLNHNFLVNTFNSAETKLTPLLFNSESIRLKNKHTFV